MTTENNAAGKLIWRLLSSTIGMYAAEFGVSNIKKMIDFFSNEKQFWEQLEQRERIAIQKGISPPWSRGAHEFLKEMDWEHD